MAEFSVKYRAKLSEENLAMPDGSYPIRNRNDLKNAISSYGRAKNKSAVKKWIIKRAKALNAEDLIPESWEDEIGHSDVLIHYGVLGMKWGVRKDKTPRSTKRQAKKDAKEYARAKMFYGEGAGTRRKHINATVNQRSKDKKYKAEFDKQLSKQDMGKHASKARAERKRKDVRKSAGKTARGLVNASVGNVARASASAIALYGVAKATGADKVVANYAKTAVKNIKPYIKSGAKWVSINFHR